MIGFISGIITGILLSGPLVCRVIEWRVRTVFSDYRVEGSCCTLGKIEGRIVNKNGGLILEHEGVPWILPYVRVISMSDESEYEVLRFIDWDYKNAGVSRYRVKRLGGEENHMDMPELKPGMLTGPDFIIQSARTHLLNATSITACYHTGM